MKKVRSTDAKLRKAMFFLKASVYFLGALILQIIFRQLLMPITEAYLEPRRTSAMKLFCENS